MFVIGDAFFEIQYQKGHKCDIKTLLISTIRTVGPSITLTSLTNSAGFFLSAIIPIPAIRNFAIQVRGICQTLGTIDTLLLLVLHIPPPVGWISSDLQLLCTTTRSTQFYPH